MLPSLLSSLISCVCCCSNNVDNIYCGCGRGRHPVSWKPSILASHVKEFHPDLLSWLNLPPDYDLTSYFCHTHSASLNQEVVKPKSSSVGDALLVDNGEWLQLKKKRGDMVIAEVECFYSTNTFVIMEESDGADGSGWHSIPAGGSSLLVHLNNSMCTADVVGAVELAMGCKIKNVMNAVWVAACVYKLDAVDRQEYMV